MRALREIVLVLGGAAVVGGLVALVAYTVDYRAQLDICVIIGLAAALAWRLARLVMPPPSGPALVPPDEPPDDGLLMLSSLESRLSWGAADPDRFRERVRPELVALATDLLRTRRGVDPRTQPEHARRILGEALWQLMTGSLRRSPTRAELTRWVEALERI